MAAAVVTCATHAGAVDPSSDQDLQERRSGAAQGRSGRGGGDFFALLGPNGAGKTTLIGIVTSLVNKTSGTASVFGFDIDKQLERAKSCIGVVPQELNFNQFEIADDHRGQPGGFLRHRAYRGAGSRGALSEAAAALGQAQQCRARPSGGMKRRLMIARALMHEPRLLILDEPTAGVDIEIRRSMWDFLRDINARGTTIILTTHYLEEAESLCRNIAIIDKGGIIERDRMSNLLRRLNTQTFVLNTRCPMVAAPPVAGFAVRRVDEHTLEGGNRQGAEPQRAVRAALACRASRS